MHLGRKTGLTIPFLGEPSPVRLKVAIDQIHHDSLPDYEKAFLELIQTYSSVFAPPDGRLPQTRFVKHTIKLTIEKPFCAASYRYLEEKHQVIKNQIKEMLAMGIMAPSSSSYSSPIKNTRKKSQMAFLRGQQDSNSIIEDQA